MHKFTKELRAIVSSDYSRGAISTNPRVIKGMCCSGGEFVISGSHLCNFCEVIDTEHDVYFVKFFFPTLAFGQILIIWAKEVNVHVFHGLKQHRSLNWQRRRRDSFHFLTGFT